MTQLERLLEAAGADAHGTNKKSEVTLCCPFCLERGYSADVSFHLGLNTFNGKAHCFRCNWKSSSSVFTAKQLRRVWQMEYQIDERELRTQRRQEPEKKKLPESIALPDEYERLGQNEDFVGRKVRRYLLKRGVSLLQIVRHRVGYAGAGEYAWRALFPVLGKDGKTYGCVGRAIHSGVEPKYMNTPGMKMLWNTERIANTAVVVEGVMDALRVETALLQMPDMSAVARLGSSITTAQLDQLKEYERVIIFPDFDLAGAHGASELAEAVDRVGVTTSIVIPQYMDGSDPGSMNDETILEHLRNVVKWSVGAKHRVRLASTRRQR